MQRPSSGSRTARTLAGMGFLVVAVHAAYTTVGVGHGTYDWIVSAWTPFAVFVLCAAICFARAPVHRPERGAWCALGAGMGLLAAGQAYFILVASKDSTPSFPSGADLLWLSLYPLAVVFVVLLVRAQRPRNRDGLWLDGLIGALAIAAVGVVIVLELVVGPVADVNAAPTAVAFALCDFLVLGFGIGACGVLGWRPPRSLAVLLVGFAVQGVQDTAYLHAAVRGTLHSGTILDSSWMFGLLVVATAAWPRPARAGTRARSGQAVVGFPFVFALLAVGLSAYGAQTHVGVIPNVLTTLTLVVVVVRLGVTFRTQLAVIEVSEHEAVTDALTGLGNRRKLLRDAKPAIEHATPEEPLTLAIFDLDGFKMYNDTYGHPAGDALLARLGGKLAAAVAPWGEGYRLGGDEFCILLWGDATARAEGLEAARAALTEQGEAFSVLNSHGSLVVPVEAADMDEALRCTDQRLYAAKEARESGIANRAYEVLRLVTRESEPQVDDDHHAVGRLAAEVGRRLGLEGDELRQLVRAAELHDIGKVAVPDAILHKPAPLDEAEWAFMRRHTTIGERFVGSIPGLESAAGLIRSSHERYDGSGYPDGLAAGAIPLGSRVIFACDAYAAMTADRAYRRGMPAGRARSELQSNAGTQFDPAVVDVLLEVLGEPVEAITLA
jgi:two-component system cell cycle response regulator